jgi:hypothetical protein
LELFLKLLLHGSWQIVLFGKVFAYLDTVRIFEQRNPMLFVSEGDVDAQVRLFEHGLLGINNGLTCVEHAVVIHVI